MDNDQYCDSIGVTGEARERCLEAMAKYGDNHWWEAMVDDRTFAYYQVKEEIFLDGGGKAGRLGRGLMALLGRSVHPHELVANQTSLLQEVERAWKYQVGCTSNKERVERINEANRARVKFYQSKGIPVIIIGQ